MKTSLFLRLCLTVIFTTFCVQCSSTPQKRITKNPKMYEALSAQDRQLVASGHIREGMTRDAVFLAWGRPDSVSVGTNRGRETEVWTFEGQRPIRTMNMGMGMGMGYGGYGYGGFGGLGGFGGYGPYGFPGYPYMNNFGGGSSVTYVPYAAGVADFAGGKVVAWKATTRPR